MSNPGQGVNFEGVISGTTPTGGVTAGLAYLQTDVYAVARETVSTSAAAFQAHVFGAVRMTKNTGAGKNFAVGDKVYIDASTKKATPNATSNTLCGFALSVAATTDTEVDVFFMALPVTAT